MSNITQKKTIQVSNGVGQPIDVARLANTVDISALYNHMIAEPNDLLVQARDALIQKVMASVALAEAKNAVIAAQDRVAELEDAETKANALLFAYSLE